MEYGERLDENLSYLVARMKAKRYKPLPAAEIERIVNAKEKI